MNTQAKFFALLCAGLWGKEVDPIVFSSATDWKAIYRLAQQQTVVGIVYDGLSTLPPHMQPQTALLRQWYSYVVKIEQSHELLNNTLIKIYTRYREEGYNPVLLKGQGIAQCYNNPRRRQCGDIDLYIGQKDYDKASELVDSMGLKTKDTIETHKHLHFEYEGVAIENHKIVTQMNNPLYNYRLYKIINNWFPKEMRYTKINSQDIALPPVKFDILFILIHTADHFLSGGIGLRQLCDWARLLHVYNSKIDRIQLKKDIDYLGLNRIWEVFGYISVHYLDLPKEEMPLYSTRLKKEADQSLTTIMNEGNFGMCINKGVRPDGYMAGKLHSFRYNIRRFRRISPLFPLDTFWCVLASTRRSVATIVKDKL